MTVTAWAAFQLPGVKVSDALSTVASPVSLLDTSMTTLVRGAASRTTVKVSVVPVSETVVLPPVSVIVRPTLVTLIVTCVAAVSPWSSSITVNDTT